MPPSGDDDNDDKPSRAELESANTLLPEVARAKPLGEADTQSSGVVGRASVPANSDADERPIRISAKVTAGRPGAVDSEPRRRRGPRPVRAGDVLGRYELVEEIGEGGMATVYRARDRELRRDVAVKVLFPHLARREEIVRRFQREARAAAGLEHENILRIYDVGGTEGDFEVDDLDPPYIVMELIRGRSLLGELEQRGAILAEVVACIGALLADALVAAHAAGIVHRDIKPANILIASDGRLLLADFGVARLETEDSLVTKTGAVLGTPAYMSPEQAHGDTATARSDLYSIGVTLYQMATGSLPFTGPTAKVLAQIASGAFVPPVRKRSSVGPDLSNAITAMMAIDAAERPASAKIVAAELRAIAAAGGLADATAEVVAYFADPEAYLAAKQPAIVAATVAAARTAIAESRLPRAMALADRASALAPEDPAVVALVAAVTSGDRSSRRNRVLAIGAVVAALGGGGVAAAYGLGILGSKPAIVPADAASLAEDAGRPVPLVDDAGRPLDDAGRPLPITDAVIADTPLENIDAAVAIDAGKLAPRDAAQLRLDAPASTLSTIPDAGSAVDAFTVSIDAAVSLDAAEALTAIIVVNDTWCDVKIDDIGRGRKADKPLPVSPGTHVVVCSQASTLKSWTQRVDVPAGKVVTVQGKMIGTFEVTIAIESGDEAIINGVHYKRGAVARLKAGHYEVTVPGVTKAFLDFGTTCSLHTTPSLGCF